MRLEADSTALDGPCRIGPPAISAEPASSPSPAVEGSSGRAVLTLIERTENPHRSG